MGMSWLHNPKIMMSEIFPWDLPDRVCIHFCCREGNVRGNLITLALFFILMGNGYSVLLAVCSAICPASFGHVLSFCMGQNILVNEWIFMPSICK
jgi:hypothetical protein